MDSEGSKLISAGLLEWPYIVIEQSPLKDNVCTQMLVIQLKGTSF